MNERFTDNHALTRTVIINDNVYNTLVIKKLKLTARHYNKKLLYTVIVQLL